MNPAGSKGAWLRKSLGLGTFFVCFLVAKHLVIAYNSRVSSPRDLPQAALISGSARSAFVQEAKRSCERTQRAHPDNKGISEAAVLKYCACLAEGIANRTTNADLATLTDTVTPEMQTTVNAVAEGCYPE